MKKKERNSCQTVKLTSVCQHTFCPLPLLPPAGCDCGAVAGSCRYQSPVPLLVFLLLLRQLLLHLSQAHHGAVDGGRAHQVEVVHADEVQEEIAAEVAADYVSAAVFHEEHDGLVHLVVCDEAGGTTAEG